MSKPAQSTPVQLRRLRALIAQNEALLFEQRFTPLTSVKKAREMVCRPLAQKILFEVQ